MRSSPRTSSRAMKREVCQLHLTPFIRPRHRDCYNYTAAYCGWVVNYYGFPTFFSKSRVKIKLPVIPQKNLWKNTFLDRIMWFISFALKMKKKWKKVKKIHKTQKYSQSIEPQTFTLSSRCYGVPSSPSHLAGNKHSILSKTRIRAHYCLGISRLLLRWLLKYNFSVIINDTTISKTKIWPLTTCCVCSPLGGRRDEGQKQHLTCKQPDKTINIKY